jgi:FkbM family methyltransferase
MFSRLSPERIAGYRRSVGAIRRTGFRSWLLERRAYQGKDVAFRVEGGCRLTLPAADRLAPQLLAGFEHEERKLIARLLRPGDVVFDVGANVGLYTLIAARKVAPEGHVYAFEPSPDTFAILDRNIRSNGLEAVVTCFELGLSDSDGEGELLSGGAAYRAYNSFGRPTEGAVTETQAVVIQRLDSVIAREGLPRPTLVKIDVEGWETHVLRGGERLFDAIDAPHVLVEFNHRAARNAGSSTDELHAELRGRGYQAFRYDAATGALVPEPAGIEYYSANLIASKRPAELAARLG